MDAAAHAAAAANARVGAAVKHGRHICTQPHANVASCPVDTALASPYGKL